MPDLLPFVPRLLKGTVISIQLTIVAIIFGLLLGLIMALGRLSQNVIVKKLSWLYIWFFRGTPLLMQLFFIYYAFPLFFDPPLKGLTATIAAFIAYSLNSAAYLAEIIRAAIQSIDKGQMEAAKALGMTYGQAMRRVIVPQSYRRLIPPVGNEFIMLIKDTSLVSAIAMSDLMRVTHEIESQQANALIYVPAAIIYLLLTTVFTVVFEKLEKKYSIYE
ncbi:MAG: amino acid ABC transporter permease [Clostridiaceae bacterium]